MNAAKTPAIGPRRLRARCAGVIAAALVSLGPIVSAAEPDQYTPAWARELSPGIEWAEVVPTATRPVLVFATRAAELGALDAATGESLLPEPIAAQAGVQMVSAPKPPASTPNNADTLVYFRDRARVFALRFTDRAELAWYTGRLRDDLGGEATTLPATRTHFQGDPEFLRRITDAAVASDGVLLACSDGQAALLSAADGRMTREFAVPEANTMQVLICENIAVFFGRRAGTTFADWLELSTGVRHQIALPSPTAAPLWTALSKHGLLVAYIDKLCLCRPNEKPRALFTPKDAQLLAATIRHIHPADQNQPELVLCGTTDGRLHACDIAAEKPLWSIADELDVAPHWSLIEPVGQWLVTGSGSAVRVRDLRDGALRLELPAPGAETLASVALRGTTLWLCWKPAGDDAPLLLESLALDNLPATTSAPAPPQRQTFTLGPAPGLLGTQWSANHLIVATRRELRAFALPQAHVAR